MKRTLALRIEAQQALDKLKQHIRTEALKMQGHACYYCWCPLTPEIATIDELHPQAKGGRVEWGNSVAACQPCNNCKGTLPADHFLAAIENPDNADGGRYYAAYHRRRKHRPPNGVHHAIYENPALYLALKDA